MQGGQRGWISFDLILGVWENGDIGRKRRVIDIGREAKRRMKEDDKSQVAHATWCFIPSR
jgi:translation elongation factor EF-4